ncbi:hypothetical protein ZZ2_053 [Enterococcus phage Ec-ZZ2]|uniref:Uncharacterized protein n=1 Tax=Enterococcus phage Ec-ZZ2 TaxID=1647400 RepID=A0A139ZW13_9CAUD|nr:hypothetical protein BJD48_gp53 [Enterococcus phage Ec-ZZ2]AKG94455.1 hypothetical protein ZZ2_053 [Enterococcus phage Ec-ZZ2]
MTTKQRYEAKLERLNKRYDKLKAEMIEAYDNGNKELGDELNDRLEKMLDVILLTETVLENLK